MLAFGDQHCSMGMAQVVEAERLTDRCANCRELAAPPEVGSLHWATLRRFEHEPVALSWPVSEVSGELIAQEPGRAIWRRVAAVSVQQTSPALARPSASQRRKAGEPGDLESAPRRANHEDRMGP